MQSGAVLLIHDRDDKPLLRNGVFAGTGTYTNIAVYKTVHKRLGKPFNQCREDLAIKHDDSIYYQIAVSASAYSYDICHAIYLQIKYYSLRCGCHNPNLDYSNTSMICGSQEQVSCMIKTNQHLTDASIEVRYYFIFLNESFGLT